MKCRRAFTPGGSFFFTVVTEQLQDEQDFMRHVEYIHFKPVKHGLVSTPSAWPYSSLNRYVAAGLYPPDWGQGVVELEGVGHE